MNVKLVRFFLSLFLIYHLAGMIIAPNSENYLGMKSQSFFSPYLSFFEIASKWSFFAPDPGPPPVFIDYEVIGEKGMILKSGLFPERKDPFILRERQNRRIAIARFAVMEKKRVLKMMGPYFCRNVKNAHSVRLSFAVEGMPKLWDVAEKKRSIGDGADVKTTWVGEFVCLNQP